MMTDEQRERYSRQLLLPELGEEGQERLLSSRVLVVGAGGLGSPVAMYLAAAGIGTLGIADGDAVNLSNLQRQIIHSTHDIGRLKVESAAEKLKRMNPEIKLHGYPEYITDRNAAALVADYDFVIEASDNPESRYRINDVCVSLGKPFCMGGVNRFSGQVMTCRAGSRNYRDVFPDKPSPLSLEKATPILSPVVGILGSVMAAEAIKCLAGIGELLVNRLLVFDALAMDFRVFALNR
ncbi:MAG: HesA/MoeB/ThiF family protein [Bacteroidaceae bacterium]|nr:HesA/MoeB/ThiF family protein [Bacteroidaceae bacterium]